jgi:hypothetical protein
MTSQPRNFCTRSFSWKCIMYIYQHLPDSNWMVALALFSALRLALKRLDLHENGKFGVSRNLYLLSQQKTKFCQVRLMCILWSRYALASRPLAIRGGCRDWAWRGRWQRDNFLTRHGDEIFEVSDVPYKDNFYGKVHGRGQNLTLQEFYSYSNSSAQPHATGGAAGNGGGNGGDGGGGSGVLAPPERPPSYVFSSNSGERNDPAGRSFLKDIPVSPSFLNLQPSSGPSRGQRGRYKAMVCQCAPAASSLSAAGSLSISSL